MFLGEHCAHLVVDGSHRHQKKGLDFPGKAPGLDATRWKMG
jgi:hypothetical protein